MKAFIPYRLLITTTLVLVSFIARAQTSVKSSVFPGGSVNASSASYKLNGMAGEDVIGQTTSASYTLRAGFALSPAERLADLQITSATIFPLTVRPGEQTAVTFSVKNTGDVVVPETAIIVKAYLSVNSVLDVQDVELASFTIGEDLAVNASIAFPVGEQDNHLTIPLSTITQSYQVILSVDPSNTIIEKNETNNFNTSALLLEVTTGGGGGEPPDQIKPTFGTPVKPASIEANAKLEIPASDNASGVETVKFFHKPITGSATSYVEEATTEASGNYSVLLQTAWADEIGIECYFTASDSAKNTAESLHIILYNATPASQSIPDLSFGGQPSDYRIFSIPYDLADNRIDEIFKSMGEYDKTRWRIVRYEGGKNKDKTEGLTKIERGQGFWFNSLEKADIRIGSGTTVNKDQSPNFTLSLAQGYNQIGDPFTFDISWADVIAANPGLSDKLSHQLLTYNSANISFEPSDNLKAWSGGFVLADEVMNVSIPATLKNGAGRVSSTAIVNNNPDLDEWIMPISIQQDEVLNSIGGIGMHPDARVSKDIYDIITPPAFLKHIGLNTRHDDFFEPLFSRDVVTTAKNYNWQFSLESNINGSPAEITWNNNDLAGARAELLLYDVAQRTLIDMKQADRYNFDPQRSRDFRFFFGADRSLIKPDVTDCGVAWPNPVVDVAHVPFLVKERSHVQIDIYDLMGRRVNRITDGEHNAGYHTATWNRNSSDGTPVSAGMYLYRMNGSATVGRLIVN